MANLENRKAAIAAGKTALGIEFGSTRIKAVLVDETHAPIASGSHDWENRLEDGVWTYSIEDITLGLQDCYRSLAEDVKEKYGETLTTVGSLGFSAMMHGYMAFNEAGEIMVPFRTWRNNMTGEAVKILSEEFQFNIPQRWTIAHLYQAILSGEEHVKDISFLTTLAGYIQWKITGVKKVGIGEASGIFPIDSIAMDYDQKRVEQFEALIADKGFGWTLRGILPEVAVAGVECGTLTEEGAKFLDPTGTLQAGIPVCPPEGDAGTGMAATNAVRIRTGNVSAGTSVFAMIVLEKALSTYYPEIDMVTTPSGMPVAMVHCQNCTSDINAWVNLMDEFAKLFGVEIPKNDLYTKLFQVAMQGDADCGGLLSYNYFSGEHVTGFDEGRPLFVRRPDAAFTLANFMRVNLYSALGALATGLNILLKKEQVQVDEILGHGGFFKTPGVGQSVLAAAINAPVSCMETAGEGGAWGMALLAAYMTNKAEGESLEDYLDAKVFCNYKAERLDPKPEDVAGFAAFMDSYGKGLGIERAAVESI